MKISELVSELSLIQREVGDIEVLGGYLSDDSGVSRVSALNAEGCDIKLSGGKAVGVFLE